MANPRAGENGKATRFRTGKEQAKTAAKGGKKSGETRRQYASFQECFRDCMDDETRAELYAMLCGRAKRGSLKAFEILRDTMGEKPKERIEEEAFEDDGLMEALRSSGHNLVDDTDLTGGEADG